MFKAIIFLALFSIVNSAVVGKSVQETVKNVIMGEYQLDKGWPHRSVSDLRVKGSSISIDSSGNIVLLHRGFQTGSKTRSSLIKENTVAVIDRSSGKVLREWGNNKFLEPHGLALAQNGDIFITDKVMHQIFKFELDNATKLWNDEPSLILGERYRSGKDEYHFCGPSDVVEDPFTGDFFVSDGYCHSRVLKYDKNGRFILQFGPGSSHPSKAPTPYNVTHSLVLAHRSIVPAHSNHTPMNEHINQVQSILLVSDRNNSRLQVFNLNGSFLYEIGSEALGSDKSWIMSVATIPPTTSGPMMKYEFGQAYVIKGYVPVGEAKVIILGLQENNFTIISSFPITKTPPKPTRPVTNGTEIVKEIKLETPHDIAVAKNGKEIYLVETLPELTLKRLVWTDIKSTGGQHGSSAKGFASAKVPERLGIIISLFLSYILAFFCL